MGTKIKKWFVQPKTDTYNFVDYFTWYEVTNGNCVFRSENENHVNTLCKLLNELIDINFDESCKN